MAEIIVVIDQEGNPAVEVNGVKGKSCENFSKALEDALGDVQTNTRTREFYEQERTNVRNTAKR